MSNFTPLVKKQYEFDGDTVHVSFSRLSRKAMLDVLPSFNKLNSAEKGTPEFSEGVNDVLNTLADALPSCVKTVSGLKDTDGSDIVIQQIVDEMYFMVLLSEITMDLIRESGVPGGKD